MKTVAIPGQFDFDLGYIEVNIEFVRDNEVANIPIEFWRIQALFKNLLCLHCNFTLIDLVLNVTKVTERSASYMSKI